MSLGNYLLKGAQSSVFCIMLRAALFQYALIWCSVQKDSKTVTKKNDRIIQLYHTHLLVSFDGFPELIDSTVTGLEINSTVGYKNNNKTVKMKIKYNLKMNLC